MVRECKTQEELSAAIAEKKKHPDIEIWLVGNARFELGGSSQVRAYGSSQVTAYGSSQVTAYDSSQVTAYGSSQVTAYGSSQVTACGSSQVTACGSSQVTAYGSSQVTAYGSSQVTAYDSSQVTAYGSSQVTAYGSSQVTAYDSSQVTATDWVGVTVHPGAKVEGGKQIEIPRLDTPALWCEFYGIPVDDGVAVMYKAVNDDFDSPYGMSYKPGTVPVAPDWDEGKAECGGGIHVSPRPFMALAFHGEATKFVGCPVKLEEVAVHPDGHYPEKVKAKGCCAPVFEVDIDGEPLLGIPDNGKALTHYNAG